MALGYQNILSSARTSGTIFDTFTTAKTVINATELVQLPPNFLYVGKKLRMTVRGALTTLVTTPGTVTFQGMMGSIVAYTTGAIQMNATAHTLLPWTLRADLRCDTIGSGTNAHFLGMGDLTGVMFTKTIAATDLWGRVSAADAAVSEVVLNVPVTAPAVGTGFDSTIANIFDFWVGFSVSSASNRVQVWDYTLEELN